MKKNVLCMAALSALMFGMVSCGGNAQKANNQEAATEEAAVIAGEAPKDLLSEELKQETLLFLKDLPSSDVPYRFFTGEVKVNVGDVSYMLPVSKASELTTNTQKARALGIYLADYNVAKAIGKSTDEIAGTISKLATDLNVTYVLDILKEEAPKDATKEQLHTFLQNQEYKVIEALANENKLDVAIEILASSTAEYACVIANPSLVVEGDAVSAGLSDNMSKRLSMLGEIVGDLSKYYPDLQQTITIISPLEDKTASIVEARAAQADIQGIRDALLK